MEREKFFVGVHAMVIKEGKILLGKRKNCFGEGNYGLPGGHLERNENLEEAMKRELLEETGLICRSALFSNIVNYPGRDKHYLIIGFVIENFEGEPILTEPDKCEGWEWFDLKDLPKNILETHKPQIEAHLKKVNYLEKIKNCEV
ncbi:MAG: NUDIX domain-containing protein [Candidatus Nomurabacteria bacterium]|nr:NUDIX domain-containing protein [Candidatus Nomurabacteria bacterium]